MLDRGKTAKGRMAHNNHKKNLIGHLYSTHGTLKEKGLREKKTHRKLHGKPSVSGDNRKSVTGLHPNFPKGGGGGKGKE